MATTIFASAIFPLPRHIVWAQLRDFSFPSKLLSSGIVKLEFEDSDGKQVNEKTTTVGVFRKIFWKNGEYQKSRLLELSDQYHTIRWELIESNPPSEVTAVISRIKCTRISETNSTLVEWSAEYSSDVGPELLKFEQKSFQANLIEMRKSLTKEPLPVIYHVHEGPSTRVVWLAYELGIPLQIEGVVPESPRVDLRKSRESEMVASNKGGMITSFMEGDIVLVESGAIIFYLLEKYDTLQRLAPPIGTPERPVFLKYFFQISSTVDHLVYESYSQMYVVGDEESVNANKAIWNGHIAHQFVDQLSKNEYLVGKQFTAVDVMFGWSLFVANLLGWLEDYPKLKEYLAKLSKRPGYLRAFSELK